ncbi:MAG: hypothetical protein M0R03_20755 [Novosphingobium sp.]|nr:hypothetical protein [Novosphingobium sp.]
MKKDYKTYWSEKGNYGLVRFERMLERKKKRKAKKGVPHKCQCCGKNTGHDVVNPYYYEMFGEKRVERLCDYCYQAARDDI